MSIILLLSAAMGMSAGAPPAGPSGRVVDPSSAVAVGSWRPSRSARSFDGRRPFRPGMGRHRDRHRDWRRDRHRDWGRRDGRDLDVFWGSGGFAGRYEEVDPYGGGFFAAGGGRVSLDGGRPYYDYDRSYPYEWAPPAAPPGGWEMAERRASPPDCAVERGVTVCRGRR